MRARSLITIVGLGTLVGASLPALSNAPATVFAARDASTVRSLNGIHERDLSHQRERIGDVAEEACGSLYARRLLRFGGRTASSGGIARRYARSFPRAQQIAARRGCLVGIERRATLRNGQRHRLAIYRIDFPDAWSGTPARAGPIRGRYRSDDRETVDSHLRDLVYAGLDGAAVWLPPGASYERRYSDLLRRAGALRFAPIVAVDRTSGGFALRRTLRVIGRSPGALRIGGLPVVVAALPKTAGCPLARSLARNANRKVWLILTNFAAARGCPRAARAFVDLTAQHSISAPDTTSITIAPVERTDESWRAALRAMTASSAPIQLIASLNDWRHETAIEPAAGWASPSGFGTYLDALHEATSGEPLPTFVSFSTPVIRMDSSDVGITIRSPVTDLKLHVEYGTTVQYGTQTADAAVPHAGADSAVSTTLAPLRPDTDYHYRFVAVGDRFQITSADAVVHTAPPVTGTRVAAVGDIACDPLDAHFHGGEGDTVACHEASVARAIAAGNYAAVLLLGDIQYEDGRADAYSSSFDKSFGLFKPLLRPAIGNHEYLTPDASGYFGYFGAAAGDPARGYYAYDVGTWHIIALNSNCAKVGGCAVGSEQERWLRADLAAHPARCTIAYWHHPRYSSGQHGDTVAMESIWADLVAAHAELVLSGHDHNYERFSPIAANGVRDDATGVRQFVVGTGGKNHTNLRAREPGSEVWSDRAFGYLELNLGADHVDWRFVTDAAGVADDHGSAACRS